MADTPVDEDLTERTSIRESERLMERIERFREDYNELIGGLDSLQDTQADALQLDSASDTRRRIMDIGMYYFQTESIPPGFHVPAGVVGGEEKMMCPECGEEGIENVRTGLDLENEEEVAFDVGICLNCGIKDELSEFVHADDFGF